MRKSLIVALLGCVVVASSVQAEENSVLDKAKAGAVHVGQVTAHGIERGATAAGNGIERGVNAAGHGIRIGLNAAANGIERGVQATKRVFDKVSDKLSTSSAS